MFGQLNNHILTYIIFEWLMPIDISQLDIAINQSQERNIFNQVLSEPKEVLFKALQCYRFDKLNCFLEWCKNRHIQNPIKVILIKFPEEDDNKTQEELIEYHLEPIQSLETLLLRKEFYESHSYLIPFLQALPMLPQLKTILFDKFSFDDKEIIQTVKESISNLLSLQAIIFQDCFYFSECFSFISHILMLWFIRCELTTSDFDHMTKLTQLYALVIIDVQENSELELYKLSSLPHLNYLNLKSQKLSNQTIQQLFQLSYLKYLIFENCLNDDNTFVNQKELEDLEDIYASNISSLSYLELNETFINTKFIQIILQFASLKYIYFISISNLTMEIFDLFPCLHHLIHLHMKNIAVNHQMLNKICQLPNVLTLELIGCFPNHNANSINFINTLSQLNKLTHLTVDNKIIFNETFFDEILRIPCLTMIRLIDYYSENEYTIFEKNKIKEIKNNLIVKGILSGYNNIF